MSFKYINPGYAKLLDNNLAQVNNNSFNPESGGICFRGGFETKLLQLPNATMTLYVSFATCIGINWDNRLNIFAVDENNGRQTGIKIPENGTAEQIYINNTAITLEKVRKDNIYTKWTLEIVSSTDAGSVVIFANGKKVYEVTNTNVMDGAAIAAVQFNINYIYLSNIIISDEPISPTEKIIAIPVSATTTDMQDNGNGIYTATDAGQTVMQTVDAASLAATIGEASKITGICAIVNPAYYDGDGLTSIKAMKGEAEQGSFALGTDTTGAASASWKENDISIADLGRMSLGWKSAT